MKKFLVLLGILAMLAFAGNVYAYSFSISPTGQIDTSGNVTGDDVSVTISLDTTDIVGQYVDSAEFELDLDLTEVAEQHGAKEPFPIIGVTWGMGFASLANNLTGDILKVTGWLATGYYILPSGTIPVATVTLDLVNPPGPWDGSDVILLQAKSFQNLHDYYYGTYYTIDSDIAGPDYGSTAVIPIPGAIYLLASGLIGLIGLRRRIK